MDKLREATKFDLARAENLVDATQNADVFVEVSGILKAHAVNLLKISADLRLLASGPRAGLNELTLPAVQAGSRMMPGKVNPVICEAVGQGAMAMIGHDAAITLACQSGQLELNAFLPLVAQSLLDGLTSLIAANEMFADRCIAGVEVDADEAARRSRPPLRSVTALVPALGYEEATRIAALRGHRQDGQGACARGTDRRRRARPAPVAGDDDAARRRAAAVREWSR